MNDLSLNDTGSAYELRQGDEPVALAAYHDEGGARVFTHTEVQPAFEGKGMASRLAQMALDDVRQRGTKAVPLCSFIAGYIDKHPAYRDLVAAGS